MSGESNIERIDRTGSVRLTVLFSVFAFLLGVVVSQPSRFEEGQTLEVQPGLSALLVNSGYQSPFGRATSLLGALSPAEPASEDWLVAASVANASALTMLGRSTDPSLLVVPAQDGAAWSVGFRAGDVVIDARPSIIDSAGSSHACVGPGDHADALRMSWDALSTCGGDVSLVRKGQELLLHVPAGGTDGSRVRDLGTSEAPAVPQRLEAARGNSSGLVLGLYYLDRMTSGSLFSEDRVAATGSILNSAGDVGAVGLLSVKVDALRRTSIDVLFVPKGQRSEIGTLRGVEVFEVSSLREAVGILCRRGASDEACRVTATKTANKEIMAPVTRGHYSRSNNP